MRKFAREKTAALGSDTVVAASCSQDVDTCAAASDGEHTAAIEKRSSPHSYFRFETVAPPTCCRCVSLCVSASSNA